MSTFTLTSGSAAALRLIASMGGTETLLLIQPARELRPEITIESMGTLIGAPLEAVVYLANQRHSMTLQRNDSANAQHLAEWVESIANGTLDTAEATPQRAACTCPSGDGSLRHPCPSHPEAEPQEPAVLLPCCKCEGEAVAYSHLAPAPAQHDLYGVKCRYGDCQSIEGAETPALARSAWNETQLAELNEPTAPAAGMADTSPGGTDHPSGVEYIEVAEHLPFCLGNAFKFLYLRNAIGNPAENIEEAIWHVNRHNETYPEKPEMPEEAREALGAIVVHEPHPFGAAMLLIAGPEQCGSYDACMEMLKAEAERLRWIAQHTAAAA